MCVVATLLATLLTGWSTTQAQHEPLSVLHEGVEPCACCESPSCMLLMSAKLYAPDASVKQHQRAESGQRL